MGPEEFYENKWFVSIVVLSCVYYHHPKKQSYLSKNIGEIGVRGGIANKA